MHTLRLGKHTRPCYSENTDSNTVQLDFNTFSAQFAIDNGTFGTDNFQERLHWWGTASIVARARAPMCPNLAMPLQFTYSHTLDRYRYGPIQPNNSMASSTYYYVFVILVGVM